MGKNPNAQYSFELQFFSRVSRLLHLRTDSSNRRAALLSSSRLFPRGTPVRAVASSASASGERWAAAVADGEVVSAPAERCDRHEDCSGCVAKDDEEECVWAAEEGRCRADGPGMMGWRAVVREGEECPVVVEEEEEETTVATENYSEEEVTTMVEEGEETQYIFFPPVPLFVYGLYILQGRSLRYVGTVEMAK